MIVPMTAFTEFIDDPWMGKTALVARSLRRQAQKAGGTITGQRARNLDTSEQESELRVLRSASAICEQARYAPFTEAEAHRIKSFVDLMSSK
jgi:dTDP-4-dehydrorhamnose reductase